jgi:1,4-dihydroxy-6-naphthoate synthase
MQPAAHGSPRRQPLRLGISTCPNDTFAFHAILERRIDLRGLEFEVDLLDVQQLNDGLFAGRYDVAKASFHAALLLADRFGILRAGAALGFGVGPLLVSARPEATLDEGARVLCPGETTTAALLFQCLHPRMGRIEHCVFSDIAPRLRDGDADFGVLIHEGRFTYRRDGLRLVEDLGATFEAVARAPIPLGGILAAASLGEDATARITEVLRESIAFGYANREDALATIRRYAQELDESVIWPYVELYVNDHTIDLGDDGARALEVLQRQARRAGILPERTAVRIFG